MILNLFETDDPDTLVEDGFELMEHFVAEENKFALAFYNLINEEENN